MNERLKHYNEKMEKTIRVLENEYSAIRAGRANPAVLDKITVDYYGTPTQIQAMAAISVSEARILVIQPWDKSTLRPIEKRRKEICKQIKKQGEDSKVAIRSIRRDANEKFKALKKSSEVSEDEEKDLEDQMQKMTDKFCKRIDEIAAKKEKEILEI